MTAWAGKAPLAAFVVAAACSEVGDAELVSMASRDPEEFGELLKRHSRAIYAYCARRMGNLQLAEEALFGAVPVISHGGNPNFRSRV
jgi:hypothetical protein